ncbi:MAG: hypothetical protein ACOYOQ_00460 [Microthrixaceae bacterium]
MSQANGGLGRAVRGTMRKFLREVERQGCTVELTRSNHVKIRLPDSGDFVMMALTPRSVDNTVDNTRKKLRRKGVDL